eukprot:gnl/TRDRNA2_/TRDRNA2_149604_c0_seq2.p1 gnl/TRDRNA2_/TRDRNA2_149604_c0~~gnl/TRDRNA2_/TRDRNA2_149604_c0_seq2.p1  ORF type:complete len:427 (+),score=104.56 gnl/TRDRNA2_/TRDRNA2_149604_c0_seq2:131-1411(+)
MGNVQQVDHHLGHHSSKAPASWKEAATEKQLQRQVERIAELEARLLEHDELIEEQRSKLESSRVQVESLSRLLTLQHTEDQACVEDTQSLKSSSSRCGNTTDGECTESTAPSNREKGSPITDEGLSLAQWQREAELQRREGRVAELETSLRELQKSMAKQASRTASAEGRAMVAEQKVREAEQHLREAKEQAKNSEMRAILPTTPALYSAWRARAQFREDKDAPSSVAGSREETLLVASREVTALSKEATTTSSGIRRAVPVPADDKPLSSARGASEGGLGLTPGEEEQIVLQAASAAVAMMYSKEAVGDPKKAMAPIRFARTALAEMAPFHGQSLASARSRAGARSSSPNPTPRSVPGELPVVEFVPSETSLRRPRSLPPQKVNLWAEIVQSGSTVLQGGMSSLNDKIDVCGGDTDVPDDSAQDV